MRNTAIRLAGVLLDLGLTYAESGRDPEAEPVYRRARDMFDALHAKSPRNSQHTAGLAQAEDSLGVLLMRTRRAVPAERALRRSLQLREELLATDPHNPIRRFGVVIGLNNLNAVLGPAQDSLEHYRRNIEILTKLAEEFPDRPTYEEVPGARPDKLCGPAARIRGDGRGGKGPPTRDRLGREARGELPRVPRSPVALRQSPQHPRGNVGKGRQARGGGGADPPREQHPGEARGGFPGPGRLSTRPRAVPSGPRRRNS